MRITQTANHYHKTSFGLKSISQKFKPSDFYINIPGYGRNSAWAEKIIETAEEATGFINRGWSFENVIKKISIGVAKANKYPLDVSKREHSGILRTAREGWRYGSDWDGFSLVTSYDKAHGNKRYRIYEERLDDTIKKPLKAVYPKIGISRPEALVLDDIEEKRIIHGAPNKINESFRLLDKLYSFLIKKYHNKNLDEKDLKVINNIIAQMRWILAHSTPWERGSDAISNVFVKALYKSLRIKTSAPAKGISFDMEAFVTNLQDYKEKFSTYFKKPPRIVNK